jgi:hypothetical protein
LNFFSFFSFFKKFKKKVPIGEAKENSHNAGDGSTEEVASVRPSRPRLIKSQRNISLVQIKMASSFEEDDAELSEEVRRPRRAQQQQMALEELAKLPVVELQRASIVSCYMPGCTGQLLSPRLSKSIGDALRGSVTVLKRSIGPLRLEVSIAHWFLLSLIVATLSSLQKCFSGANVVNSLMRLKYADNREEVIN